MNLHGIAGPIVGAVNPNMLITVQASTGASAPGPDGTRTPAYADPVELLGQVQPLGWRDLQQLEGLNLQGTKRVIYLSGDVQGIVRQTNQGGDLVTMPDGTVWLVVMILEGFNPTAGWTKCAIVLQDGS